MARTVDPELHRTRRLQILDAAIGCFAANGYAATTTAQICAAAAMSPGHLYHYFPSKQAIFLGIFQLDEETTPELITRALANPDPVAGVLELVEAFATELTDPRAAGLALAVLERVRHDPELAALMERIDAGRRAGLVALLERAERDGRIGLRHRAEHVATWILGLVDVLFTQSSTEFVPSEQIPLLLDIVTGLIGPR